MSNPPLLLLLAGIGFCLLGALERLFPEKFIVSSDNSTDRFRQSAWFDRYRLYRTPERIKQVGVFHVALGLFMLLIIKFMPNSIGL